MNTLADLLKLSNLTFPKTYIMAWLFINWKVILIALDINSDIVDKINAIDSYFSYWSFPIALLYSILIALVTLIFGHIFIVFKTSFETLNTLVIKKASDRITSVSDYYYASTTRLNLILLNYIVSVHSSLDQLEQASKETKAIEIIREQIKNFRKDLQITDRELVFSKKVIEFVSKKLSSLRYNFTNTKRDIVEIYALVILNKNVEAIKKDASEAKEEEERITQELFNSLRN